jgi:hypothetical protein
LRNRRPFGGRSKSIYLFGIEGQVKEEEGLFNSVYLNSMWRKKEEYSSLCTRRPRGGRGKKIHL